MKEKVGEGIIRKMRTGGKSSPELKPAIRKRDAQQMKGYSKVTE